MRYLPHTTDDIEAMLHTAGVASLDELFSNIPDSLRMKQELDVPDAMSEWDLDRHMAELSGSNASSPDYTVYIGAGSYSHHIPAALPYLLGRSEFSTAYTPYQPEISQGTLQGIYEFQTMICSLIGMDVATASHYDCGTALSEALLIALRKNKKAESVAVSSLIHPHHRQILETYLRPSGYGVIDIPGDAAGRTDFSAIKGRDDIAAIAVQSPNFFGCIEDLAAARAAADEAGSLFICSFTEAIAYGLLRNPGSFGADITAGEGQSLGISQSFGGPGLGILSARKAFMRDLPGRLVGRTFDADGEPGFVLTLSTREQHIRREKASSNICSNNGLNAMTAAMYMAFAGKTGLRTIASLNHDKAAYLKSGLTAAGFTAVHSAPFFNEFVLKAPPSFAQVRERLKNEQKIVAGLSLETYFPELADHYLFCATETVSKADMDRFFKEVN